MGLQVASPRGLSSSSCLPWPSLWLVCSVFLPLYSLLPVFYKDTSHVRSQPYPVAFFNLNSFLEACLHTWSPGIWGFNICTSVTAIMSFLFMGRFGKGLLSPLGSHTSCEVAGLSPCLHSCGSRSHTPCKAHMGPQVVHILPCVSD